MTRSDLKRWLQSPIVHAISLWYIGCLAIGVLIVWLITEM